MPFEKAFVPYGLYWSSPFCRWQGSFGDMHAIELAASVAGSVLDKKGVPAESFDGLHLGWTVPQRYGFYGAPWVAGMLGAPGISGANVARACATSAHLVASSALEIEGGTKSCVLSIAGDRTSNGPHVYYPNPKGVGGRGDAEDWVWDNFNYDPFAKNAMIATAENVAKEAGITREEQDELTLIRHAQYQDSLADDRAFQRRYMAEVTLKRGRKEKIVDADEGVFPTTAEGLAKLKPVTKDGSVTFGVQTFPADGNAGIVVCNEDKARALSPDGSPTVRVVSVGEARAKKGYMAMAVVPAARQALDRAGIAVTDCAGIKTHNPFAVNDVYFAKEMKVAPDKMNRFGSPLIYGHPQAPTGLRAMVELIEELAAAGGGYGLFSGCAAGDTAMAVVFRVD